MAPRMKWLLATAGSCLAVMLLVFVAIDPARPGDEARNLLDPSTGNPDWRHPLVQRVWQIQGEVAAANEVLRQETALAAAYDALPATPGLAVELNLGPWTPPRRLAGDWVQRRKAELDSSLAALPRLLETQVAGYGGSRSRLAVVGVPKFRTPGDAEGSYAGSAPVRYFAGEDERGGFCIIAIETNMGSAWSPDAVLLGGNPLGPCRLWARYGDPGPAVLAWLGKSGHLMDFESPLPDTPQPTARRGLFGWRHGAERLHVRSAGEGCLAGRRDVCVSAALDPSVWAWAPFAPAGLAGPALHARGRWYGNASLTVVGAMFGDLERDLGPEAFGRFWRTAGPAEVALEAELGEDVDAWMMHWLREHVGAEPLGPTVPTGTLLLSLLTIAALVVAAITVAARRQTI